MLRRINPAFAVCLACAIGSAFTNPTAFGKAPSYDPYGYSDYAAFRARIQSSLRENATIGILTIGPIDNKVGGYMPHCRVDSGYFGPDFPDGVYECFCDGSKYGVASMRPVKVPKAMEGPVPPSTPTFQLIGGIQFGTGCANGTCRPAKR